MRFITIVVDGGTCDGFSVLRLRRDLYFMSDRNLLDPVRERTSLERLQLSVLTDGCAVAQQREGCDEEEVRRILP